nr:hypothetical protein [Tanacetum cinerariifolium]
MKILELLERRIVKVENILTSNSNKRIVKKRKVVTDIRDIVQGTYHRPSKRLASEETSSGLMIKKKIMRRTTDNKDSLVQVQSLRQEIREAICNRSSKEAGDNIFDPKLLAAFKIALAGKTTKTTRTQPLDVKANKALLQKGTVRENLTKKIYTSDGKRKQAWTRDCEIDKDTKVVVSCNNSRPTPRKVNPNKSSYESSRSLGGTLVNAQKQTGNGSTDVKFNKRKWALDVLARKTAVARNNSSQGQDNAVLKGNYPLLAKLPVEMRPSLAPSRHNKIPVSVRQDLLHQSNNMDCSTAPESEPKVDPETVTGDDIPTSADVDVDEALRNAGLLSDSPPASPNQYETDDTKDHKMESRQDRPDQIMLQQIWSTLDFDKSDSAWRCEDHEAPVVVENANEDNNKEKSSLLEGGEDENLDECKDIYGPDKEPLINKYPHLKLPDLITKNNVAEVKNDQGSNLAAKACAIPNGNCSENLTDLSNKSLEKVEKKKKPYADKKQQSDKRSSVFKKVEAYIKEHIRPLCKSGVITVEQYRWAVGKTTDKIMTYHSKDINANFLIKEGEKVKKLAEQYVETAQNVENNK